MAERWQHAHYRLAQFKSVQILHGPRTSILIYISDHLQLQYPSYYKLRTQEPATRNEKLPRLVVGEGSDHIQGVSRCFVSGAERSLHFPQ